MHLTYCLNIHKGESWADNFAAIRKYAVQVAHRVSGKRQFGLGLRLSAKAAIELSRPGRIAEFKRFLVRNRMYVFTVNGFPYGAFHGTSVKEKVYEPDWREAKRLAYTLRIADIMAALLPQGVQGSISTVPGCYRFKGRASDGMVGNLVKCALYLERLAERTGREVVLALEPEPDCLCSTTSNTLDFFKKHMFAKGIPMLMKMGRCGRDEAERMIRKRIGLCVDTCHFAVEFESPLEAVRAFRKSGITVAKVQISAAMVCPADQSAEAMLVPFQDGVYLHQTRVKCADGSIRAFRDLDRKVFNFLAGRRSGARPVEVRTHFHVPVYHKRVRGLPGSTSGEITKALLKEAVRAGCEHFELETYTFDVLPEALRKRGVVNSIVREFSWLRRCGIEHGA